MNQPHDVSGEKRANDGKWTNGGNAGTVADIHQPDSTAMAKVQAAITPTPKERQHVTETPAFKAWFGDSKVVDESGKPLIVWHGGNTNKTPSGKGYLPDTFDAFDTSKINQSDPDYDTNGFHFAVDQEDGFGEPRAFYLSIKNPAPDDTREQVEKECYKNFMSGKPLSDGARSYIDESRIRLQKMGYDGFHAPWYQNQGTWIAFSPTQIKSATGNTGKFDPQDPRINMSQDADCDYSCDCKSDSESCDTCLPHKKYAEYTDAMKTSGRDPRSKDEWIGHMKKVEERVRKHQAESESQTETKPESKAESEAKSEPESKTQSMSHEDQPRDDSGRWTTEIGGSSSGESTSSLHGNTETPKYSQPIYKSGTTTPNIGIRNTILSLSPSAHRGALVGIRELREKIDLPKQEFDEKILRMSRGSSPVLSLHHHDFVSKLTDAEREELVSYPVSDNDRMGYNGRAYVVGVALRQYPKE